MDVRIVEFPQTRVAAVEHRGPPDREHETARRLVHWRIARGLSPERHATYGVHHTDPATVAPDAHRVDFCVAYDGELAAEDEGIVLRVLPRQRCAVARHVGPRDHVDTAERLVRDWLPTSGESIADAPLVFHYVNVGPGIAPEAMITDVYLPLRRRD